MVVWMEEGATVGMGLEAETFFFFVFFFSLLLFLPIISCLQGACCVVTLPTEPAQRPFLRLERFLVRSFELGCKRRSEGMRRWRKRESRRREVDRRGEGKGRNEISVLRPFQESLV